MITFEDTTPEKKDRATRARKESYCQMMNCLFNADLINSSLFGEGLRKNVLIEDLI